MFSDYCRDFYSKCTHCDIAFTETHIFSEGEEPEVNYSSFTNTWPILISNSSITIYVPRAFQRATPRPLILQHVKKALA